MLRRALLLSLLIASRAMAAPPTGRIVIDLSHGPTNRFTVDQALGAGLDGMPRGEVDALFTPHNVEALSQAGLKPITYRLRTELAIQAWHWNPAGTWSDAAHSQGYWTSSGAIGPPIMTSWGYRLPRRGDTVDQAGDNGFSRLDDGDPATFWKSNPYLDRRYAGDDHPQWLVASFAAPVAIDAARIVWATPYAVRFKVQYWIGADEYDDEGRWVTFPGGDITDGRGGEALLRLAPSPIRASFLRVLMQRSSGTAPAGSADARDALGYAVAEVGFGVLGADGRLRDAVRHAPDRHAQTVMTVSSTDPWHRASDRDLNLEQPGFDRLFASGLTNALPVMIPVGALYDTPDNAAAELRYLRRRGYPVRQVELGEEPDGQNVPAADFAALYVQFAAAIHAVDPTIQTGGPSLQDGVSDVWLEPGEDRSWTHRFIVALQAESRMSDLGFFSFERYPNDSLCDPLDVRLRENTQGLAETMARLRADGVPATIPWVITEYGASAFGGEAEDDLPGALANADIAAQFLSLGGQGAFLFGYGPNLPFHHGPACAGDGELMIWEADEEGQAKYPLPAFQGARMLTHDWAGPTGVNEIYPALSDIRDAAGRLIVSAYAVRRPDGRLAVLLLNRDAKAAHAVSLVFRDARRDRIPAGPLAVVQYGPDQYAWRAAGLNGRPVRSDPPRRFDIPGTGVFKLPPYSLTVVTLPM